MATKEGTSEIKYFRTDLEVVTAFARVAAWPAKQATKELISPKLLKVSQTIQVLQLGKQRSSSVRLFMISMTKSCLEPTCLPEVRTSWIMELFTKASGLKMV